MRAFLLAVGLVTVAACGGRAALEAYMGESQSGSTTSGGGDGPVSSSSGQGGAATSSTSSQGGFGPMTTNTTNGVGGSSGLCDESGNCRECAQCAFDGPCASEWDECFATPDCQNFQECISDCMGGGCFFECQQEYPQGAEIFLTAYRCILCVECEEDCAGEAPPMLCQ